MLLATLHGCSHIASSFVPFAYFILNFIIFIFVSTTTPTAKSESTEGLCS